MRRIESLRGSTALFCELLLSAIRLQRFYWVQRRDYYTEAIWYDYDVIFPRNEDACRGGGCMSSTS